MYYSWKLTLVIICTVPIMLVVLGWLGSRIQLSITTQQEKLTEALKYITSALNSIDIVKCFNGQSIEVAKYGRKISEAAQWYYKTVNINAQQAGITQFMASVMYVQAFYYGGVLVDKAEKSTGDVVTTFMSALGAFSSISGIVAQLLVLEKGRTAGATLRSIMSQVESGRSIVGSQNTIKPAVCRGNINFDNVGSFERSNQFGRTDL